MKAKELIPYKKEFIFLVKLILAIMVSSAAGIIILIGFLDTNLDNSYRNSFKILSEIYRMMNIYISISILIQVVLSSVIVFFLSLYFSHKIAGPMYRLKMLISSYLNNESIQNVSFRQGDFLDGVGENFTHFFHFHNQRKSIAENIKSVTAELEESPHKKELVNTLKQCLGEAYE